jgi:hypothetical protein
MCIFLIQIIKPSFLSHFPIFYAFFFQQKPVLLPKHQKTTLNLTFYPDF